MITAIPVSTNPKLQDSFLAAAQSDATPLTVFLVNGFQMRGTIQGFDEFTLVLDADGRQNLIYKHAISTLCPMIPVHWEG